MSKAGYSTLIAALTAVTSVAGHGHVTNIVINGVSYQGYDSTSFPYQENPPVVVGWTTNQPDNGFVAPDLFGAENIICHNDATPAGGHATVAAGDSISIQWNTWPESHKGPMIDYLASCEGPCETVDKTALKFFKIDGAGVEDGSTAPGTWASDTLIANNNTWLVKIPEDIKAGNYVLRHETIALHSAGQANGAQSYPQCFNLAITGAGTAQPEGVLGTALYTAQDPGILFDVYTAPIDYTIPGPELIAGAEPSVAQSSSAITTSASATVGSDGAAPTGGAGAGETTAAAAPTTTTEAAPSPDTPSTTAAATDNSPTAAQPTTLSTSVKPSAPSTTAAAEPAPTATGGGQVGAQAIYAQCGGKEFGASAACAEGSTCKQWNEWYFQCVPNSS